jgi:hypothetical protein
LYEAFLRNWHDKPELGGFSIWEWQPGDIPADDRGYTPKNKPAAKVLHEWLVQPTWEVKIQTEK